ncbi:MAG: hypothetical protein NWE76_02885, partial [Candidatus Bathyarchaeota archaeon]|nr:hypothetical protein [Candidatus Bathyarchaeota archaeon]
FGQFAQAPNVGFGQSEVLPQEFYDLRNRKAELEDIIAGVDQLEDTLAETLPDSPIIVGPDGRYLPMDLDPNKDWVFSRAFLRANQDIMNNNPLARFGWNIGSAVLLGIWDILKAGGRALTAPIGYAIEARNRRKDGYEDVLDRSVWDLMKNGSDSIPTLNAYMYDLQHPDSVEFVRRFVVAEESMRLLAEVFDKKVGLIPGEVEELSLAGTPYAANQLAILKDLGESLGFEVTPEDLDIVSPEELGVLFGQISEKTKAQQQQDIASYNKISDRKKAIIAELSALKQQYFSDYEMDEMSYWEQVEKYREELTSLERELWSLSRTSPFVSDMTYTYTESMQLLNNPATGENDQEKYMLGVTQALADAQLQMDEMLSPEQREGIAKNWSDPEAEFLGQFVFDAFNAVPGELFADVLKGVFKGAKWAAFKVPGVKASVDWIGQQALSAMASRMARWASPDLQGIARAVTHMEGPDGFYSVLRKLLGGQLNVKDLGKYRLTVRSVENWTKILTLLGKGSDAGVLAVDEFMDLVNLVQRGAQTELLMKYGNMTIDELSEASGMILMSRGDKQRAIDFLVARALNDPNTHIPGILEAIRTTYRKLPVNRAFAGGPFSDTVLGQLSKLVKLDLPEKELANWQKNSKRFIRWWMTLNYHAKKIWSSLVLTARPAFTVFNYTDSAFRALMHGARLFDDIGDIYKMAPVWVEDIPGAFMQVGGGTPGELDIAHMVIEKARQGQRYKLIDIMRDAMRLEGYKPWTPAGWMAAVNALNSAFETSFRMRLYAPRFAKEWKLATILMEQVLESKGYFDDAYVRQVYDYLIQTSNGKPEVMADLIDQIVSGEVRPGSPYGITLPEGLFEEVASRMGRGRAEVFLRSIQQELLDRMIADGELTDDAIREIMEKARAEVAEREVENLVQRPREIDADGALNMSPDPDSNSMAMYDEMTDGQIEKQLDEALENRTTPHAEDVNTSQMNKIDPRAPTVRSLDRIVQEAQAAAPKAEALADVPSWTGSSRSGHVFSRGDNDPHALMIVAEVQERGATEYKIFNAAGDDITREVSKTKRAYYGGLNNEVKPAVQKYYDSLVEAADSFSRGEIKVRANLADEVDAGIINVRGTKFMYTAEYGDKTFVRLMDSNGNTWYAPIEQFPDTVKWEKYANLDDLINPPPTPGLGGAKKPDWNKELAAIQREMKGYSVADFRNKLSQYHKVGHSSEFLNPDSPNAIVKRLKSGEKTMEQETWDLIVGWYDELQSSQKGHAHAVELGVRSPDIPIIPSRKKVIKFSSLQDPYQTFYELLAISDELQSSTFKVQRIGEGAVEVGDEALASGIVEKAGRKPTMFNEEAMIVTYAMEDLESLRKGMKIVVPDEKVFDRKKAEALLLQWEKERIADAIAQGTKVIDEETITVKKKRLEKIKKDKKLSDVEAQKQAIYEATSNRRVKPKKIVKPTEEAIENTEQLKKSAPKAKRTPRDVASEAVDELRKQKLAAETAVAKDFDPNDIKIGTRIKSTKGTRAIVLERIELEEGVVNSYIVQDEAGKIREIQPGSISSVHGQATADQLTKIKVPDEVADIEEPDMEDLVGITFEIDPQVDIDLARQFEIEFYDAFEGQAYKERMSLAEVIQRRQELVSDAMKDEIKYERWLTTAQSKELAEAGIGS